MTRMSTNRRHYLSDAAKTSLRDARSGLSRYPARSKPRRCLLLSSRSGDLLESHAGPARRCRCSLFGLVPDDQSRALGGRARAYRFVGCTIPPSEREVCTVPECSTATQWAPVAEPIFFLSSCCGKGRKCTAVCRVESTASRNGREAGRVQMVERGGAFGGAGGGANSFIRLELLARNGWSRRMEEAIGNGGGRAGSAAPEARNLRWITAGFRWFCGGNGGKIWTTLEEFGTSEEGCPKRGKGDEALRLRFGRLIRRKVRLTRFSPGFPRFSPVFPDPVFPTRFSRTRFSRFSRLGFPGFPTFMMQREDRANRSKPLTAHSTACPIHTTQPAELRPQYSRPQRPLKPVRPRQQAPVRQCYSKWHHPDLRQRCAVRSFWRPKSARLPQRFSGDPWIQQPFADSVYFSQQS